LREKLDPYKPVVGQAGSSDHIDREITINTNGSQSGSGSGKSPLASDAPYEALLQILWRRRLYPMAGAAALGLIGLIYLLFATPIYSVSSSVTVQPVQLPTAPLINAQNTPVSENFLNTQAELMTSTPTLALALSMPAVDDLNILDRVVDRLAFLKKQLKVDVGKKVDIITVTFESSDPVQGSTLVNSVVDAYKNYQSKQMKSSAAEVLNVLKKEMDDLHVQLDKKNKELYEFRRAHNTLTLGDDKGNITSERLNRLSQELSTVDVEVLNAKSGYQLALQEFNNDPSRAKRLAENKNNTPGVMAVDETALKAAMFDMQQRLQNMSHQYMPNHPLVQAAHARLDQLQLAYMTLMQQKYTAAKQKRDDLQNSIAALNKEAIEQSGDVAKYQQLASDVQNLRDLQRNLDDRIKTTNLTENVGAMNITVVDLAQAGDPPIRPKKAVTLLVCLILGGGLGLLVAFFREYTDRSLKSADDIEKSLGLSVLGAVPSMPRQYAASTRARAIHLNPGSEAAESYRSLRSALVLNASARKFKTFLITSPADGDGKTTVACNLAIALAKQGARVLLVDTNLRDPGVHTAFGLPNDRGLSTVLSGDTEGQTIQSSGINNLDVLAAGPMLDDPADLLNSPLLTETMVQLSRMYEMVIVDAAGILPVVDGRIVAASCDASILVLNAKKSDGKISSQACEGLLSVGAEILGVVVNDVSAERLEEGFDVSYAHLGGYNNEFGQGRSGPSDRTNRARSNP
jgi:capsular exopolysaccharide synthesis family protein